MSVDRNKRASIPKAKLFLARLVLLLFALFCGGNALAITETINFSAPGGINYSPAPSPYNNFNWTGFYYCDGVDYGSSPFFYADPGEPVWKFVRSASQPFTLTTVSLHAYVAEGTGDTTCTFNGYRLGSPTGTPVTVSSIPRYSWQNYSINLSNIDEVRVTGCSLVWFDDMTITYSATNNAPTNISLSASSVNENVAANTSVGTLSTTDPDVGDTFTYSLVAGGADNGSFNISGSSLRINSSPNYEAQSSYSVRIRTTDAGGAVFDKDFTITVNNLNETPTDISISSSSINENVAANSPVGTLSSTDPDAGNTFTYTLVAGTGSTDNGSFNIAGSSLRITNSPDFESKSSYSVRVRTTDQGALIYEEALTITINNINETPTDISLAPSSINENSAPNTEVGTFSSTDTDAGNTFTYTLVAGAGDTDNGSFSLSGSSLRASVSLDYETRSSYSVRVRTTDQGGLWYEEAVTVTVNNANETPTDISLSSGSINENVLANSTVGALTSTDADAGNTFNYTLATGAGDTDNASFSILGSSLRITGSPNYENKSLYSVRVRSTDQGGLWYEESFTITINNVNETPNDIGLSAVSIAENQPSGTTVGTLSTTDIDAGNTFTYTLAAGAGDTDNASFSISGSSLRASASFDYETKSSYSVRVRTTDQGGLTYEEAFTVTVTNENEAPSDVALSPGSIAENQPSGTAVGTLSSTDVDAGDTFTYTLVAGPGSADNASFTISGGSLLSTASFDSETKSTYAVRVRATDLGGLYYEEALTITVTSVNEPPTAVADSFTVQAGDTAAGIVLSNDTDPEGDTLTAELVSDVTNGALILNSDGSYSYTHDGSETVSDSFTYKAKDGSLYSGNATVTITVTPVNDPPVISAIPEVTFAMNGAATSFILPISDPDNDLSDLTINVESSDLILLPVANFLIYDFFDQKVLEFAPAADQFGHCVVSVSASDGEFTTVRSFIVTVTKGGASVVSVTPPAGATYNTGDNLDFTVTYGEIVYVGGAPRLTLTAGAATVYADYLSGSGTASLVFRHIVQSGEADSDGVAVAASVGLNGGAILDDWAIDATLSFTAPDTSGILIDGVPPGVDSIGVSGTPAASSSSVDFAVTFSEPVAGVDAGDFSTAVTGGVTATISGISGSGSSYTVSTTGVTGSGTLKIDLKSSGTSIVDGAGNPISGGFTGGTAHIVTSAGCSESEQELTLLPTLQRFKTTTIGGAGVDKAFTVKNIGALARTVTGPATLSGPDAGEFSVTGDLCDGVTLLSGESCTVTVTYLPTVTGSKAANLEVPTDDAETPVLVALLANHEPVESQAPRRLPPVISAINVPETMNVGTPYSLTWSVQGYDDNYLTNIVLFDCTGISSPDCGANYSDASRFAESGYRSPSTVEAGDWVYDGVPASKFNYQWSFNPALSATSDIVVRFYITSADDYASGKEGISLLIPGNLSDTYYDTAGRRIQKQIYKAPLGDGM